MSHSKFNKRGNSLYIQKFNPEAKKYINTCTACGIQGYSPSIDCDGFTDAPVRRVMCDELKRMFPLLVLDDYGRCVACAKQMNAK